MKFYSLYLFSLLFILACHGSSGGGQSPSPAKAPGAPAAAKAAGTTATTPDLAAAKADYDRVEDQLLDQVAVVGAQNQEKSDKRWDSFAKQTLLSGYFYATEHTVYDTFKDLVDSYDLYMRPFSKEYKDRYETAFSNMTVLGDLLLQLLKDEKTNTHYNQAMYNFYLMYWVSYCQVWHEADLKACPSDDTERNKKVAEFKGKYDALESEIHAQQSKLNDLDDAWSQAWDKANPQTDDTGDTQ